MDDDTPEPIGPEPSPEASEGHHTHQGTWGTGSMRQRTQEKDTKREGDEKEDEGGEEEDAGAWVVGGLKCMCTCILFCE